MTTIQETAKRYVKRISANPEMSHNKILARIKENSTVLEFGPASGAMTKVLKQMNCEVYIVEIDRECYEEVIQYADGGFCGDIEELGWRESLKEKKFDCIIFADVLEHLKNPEKVLKIAKLFLKREGSVLLSVPNIAHNSILLQLFQNKFIYQSTGILDYSHIRHFTYSEIVTLCKDTGFSVIYMDAVYIGVGRNEFDVFYQDVPIELAEILKRRPFGEVYQHILEIKDRDYAEENRIKIENRLGEKKEYIPVFEELELKEKAEEKTENESIIEALSENPNKFFASNEEIARLRLEINEIYNINPELEQIVRLKKRIYDCEEEIRKKNCHIWKLDSQQEEKDKRIDTLQNEVEERNRHIEKLDREIEENRKKITECENKIEQTVQIEEAKEAADKVESLLEEIKNKYQQEYQKQIENKNIQIQILESQIKGKDHQIEILEGQKKEKNNQIEALEENIKLEVKKKKEIERELQEIRQIKEETCVTLGQEQSKLSEATEQYNQEKLQLEQIIRNKEGHIELLLESDRELERIKHSKSWKGMKIIWKIAAGVLPPNSKRRLAGKLCVKLITHPIQFIRLLSIRKIKNFFYYLKKDGVPFVSKRLEESIIGVKLKSEPIEINQIEQSSEKNISDYKILVFPQIERPDVSIIIPIYNQFDYTYLCLQSILKNTENISYEIIIADDGSVDLTKEIKEVIKNITVITNTENLRFLKNCNHAANYAKGKYLLFLNNDTQVQKDWLDYLISSIEKEERVGMVGAKLIYADGTLQEAGGILWKDGSAWNYGNRQNPEEPEFNYVKEADYISGACIMIRTELWKKIGGFDKRFVPAYYEDTDLAFEVRKYGYKVVYQPLAKVIHFEGISNGTNTNSGQKKYQEINANKFYEKWKDVLEREHFENGKEVFKARDRSRFQKHILVVDHYVPMYDKDAGNKCSYMYLKLFVELGFHVTLIGDNFYKHEPYSTELNQLGIEILYGNYYYNNWKQWLKENAYNFDYIYLQRPHISEKYIDLVREYSNAKIIYFGHDLHYLREYRQYLLTKEPELLKSSNSWKKKEFDLFKKADVIYVVGNYEEEILKKEFPDKPIRNIPVYIYDTYKEKVNNDFCQRKDILFVGGFGHPPNIDAVIWFAKEIFPEIAKKYSDIKWYIAGFNPPKEIQELENEQIKVLGFIPDEELSRLYAECRLAVVPLRVGAGVKGKVVEAVYNRIPLITTEIGAEGLSLNEDAFVVTDCSKEMASVINSLYCDEKRLKELSEHGKKFIENSFTKEVAKKIVLQDFQL